MEMCNAENYILALHCDFKKGTAHPNYKYIFSLISPGESMINSVFAMDMCSLICLHTKYNKDEQIPYIKPVFMIRYHQG